MTSKNIRCISRPVDPVKCVLFLGYNESQTKIINELIKSDCHVDHTDGPITENLEYDFVISFGYRHILRGDVIQNIGCPIFNLHISYLLYNRGAHPNFWSFYDNTPAGVTVHLIDEGVDTGPIVYQKYVNFDAGETTFMQTHARLIDELEGLFVTNLSNILTNNWTAKPQRGMGSHHRAKDLPKNFSGWESDIADELKKLDREGRSYE